MNYELEITFNNGELYYLTSTTNFLNNSDKEFLNDENIDLNNIKSVNSHELQNKRRSIVPDYKYNVLNKVGPPIKYN